MPDLSLIIPCLNPPESFYSMLQSVVQEADEGLEVLISNAGGLDGSRLPKSDLLNCISEPDSGQADAINKGIKRTTGDIIGYLNTDDLLFPNALNRVRDCFLNNPFMKILYGQGVHIDEEGNWLEDYPTRPWNYEHLKSQNSLCQPAVFWRSELREWL